MGLSYEQLPDSYEKVNIKAKTKEELIEKYAFENKKESLEALNHDTSKLAKPPALVENIAK